MCGRYVTGSDELTWAEYRKTLELPGTPPPPETREVYPRSLDKVLVNQEGKRHLEEMYWGFPFGGHRVRYNARAESVRNVYGNDFKERRCLIPVVGFFFWTGDKGKKTRHRVELPIHSPAPWFTLGGLWHFSSDGSPQFTILTTKPSAALATLHDRMPVIVEPEDHEVFLDPTADVKAIQMGLRATEGFVVSEA